MRFAWPRMYAIVLTATLLVLSGRVAADDLQRVLAPTGTLRIGVYPGSPTSEIRDSSGKVHGVTVDVGEELGRRLGVPTALVEYPRAAEVVDGIVAGQVDMTVTNATPMRAEKVAFTSPLLALELGFLVPSRSMVENVSDLDNPEHRVGVTQGGTSERTIRAVLKHAVIVPVATLKAASEMLRGGSLDAYATNKSVLFELSDNLPGSRVLADRWGLEHLAIGYPKGREAAATFLERFRDDIRGSGFLATTVEAAGLRGQASEK
jgi:polar amino acid transport system substrate-binding protein